MASFTGRFRELLKKYGKVAVGVHFSVSAASITGLYVAIKNNVDIESLLEKFHMDFLPTKDETQINPPKTLSSPDGFVIEDRSTENQSTVIYSKTRNNTAELVASTGGALALALICNKALLPIRVPITVALTPPIARLLRRRGIIKNDV